MAEQPRTYADLLTAYADNTARAITEEDGRDLIESTMGCFGSMIITNASASQQAINNSTWTALSGWNLIEASRHTTVDTATGEITLLYDGVYHLSYSLSFSLDGKDTVSVGFSVNGADPVSGGFQRKVQNSGDIGSMSGHRVYASGSAGDAIDIVARLDTLSSLNITSRTAVFTVSRVG